MDYKEKFKQVNDFEWILDKSHRKGMNVDAKLIASKVIFDAIEKDTLAQLTNVAMLPGVIDPVLAMPDAHFGYGFPIGSVAAFDMEKGVISAGLCGFDINCGINLIRTNLTTEDLKGKENELVEELYRKVPVGVGAKGKLRLTSDELDVVLENGLNWALENNYGTKHDLEHTEEKGCMSGADSSLVSDLAKKRGSKQLGTLGAGNHFIEVQRADKVFDDSQAKAWGIKEKNQLLIMLHCGSRGLGHQIATDYLKIQEGALKKYKINLPDKQLACAPASSPEGINYFGAMQCAVNYSFTNRLVMTDWIREAFEKVFNVDRNSMEMKTIYGICHNVVKIEKYIVNGEKRELFIHRKGATRAFPDEPVLIAGSMGTSSYLCKGTQTAMSLSFGSSAHGAGRCMSRKRALKEFRGEQIKNDMAKKGIASKATGWSSYQEEAPMAYKDVESVIDSVVGAGVSKRVLRLIPVCVVKG